MKTLLIPFIFATLSCGCSSTYTVGAKEAGADYEFSELGAEFGKEEVKIILVNGEERRGTEVICSRDSISWQEPLTTLVRWAVPRSQVYVVERINGKNKATISFTNGQQESSEDVVVTNDSVAWIGQVKVSPKVTLSTAQIKKIVLTNHFVGVPEGAGIGVLAGIGAGILAAAIILHGNPDPEAQLAYPILTFYGASGGLAAGTLIGFIFGHKYEYDFTNH